MPGKQIAPGKLVSAMLAFIRSISSVYMFLLLFSRRVDRKKRTGSHMACDMLRTSESSVTDRTFVVTSHVGGEGEEEEMVVG